MEGYMKIIAVIPAYNEAKYIKSVVVRTKASVTEVVVADDDSRDATVKEATDGGALIAK